VAISEFENKTEQRRLLTPDRIMGWKITTPFMTQTQFSDYLSIFDTKYGALTSFTFTCPFTATEYNVRFRPGTFRAKYENGVFKAEFEFERVL
jgi:hypothetical protein